MSEEVHSLPQEQGAWQFHKWSVFLKSLILFHICVRRVGDSLGALVVVPGGRQLGVRRWRHAGPAPDRKAAARTDRVPTHTDAHVLDPCKRGCGGGDARPEATEGRGVWGRLMGRCPGCLWHVPQAHRPGRLLNAGGAA